MKTVPERAWEKQVKGLLHYCVISSLEVGSESELNGFILPLQPLPPL